MSKPDMQLWLDSGRGVYIPRDFANSFKDRAASVAGVRDEDWSTLEKGPDEEWYWEAWTNVTNNAIVTDENGVKYQVHQDGDVWLIPEGMEYQEENDTFAWPDETTA